MNDKNLHINQQLNSNYPEPDVPADTAWADMDARLNAELPPPSSGSGIGGSNGINGFWKLLILIVIIGGIFFWGFNKISEKSKPTAINNQTESKEEKQSSGNLNSLVDKKNIADEDNILNENNIDNDSLGNSINNRQHTATTAQDTLSNKNSITESVDNLTPKPIIKPGKELENTSANKFANKNAIQLNLDKLNSSSQKNNQVDQLNSGRSIKSSTIVKQSGNGLDNNAIDKSNNSQVKNSLANTEKNNSSVNESSGFSKNIQASIEKSAIEPVLKKTTLSLDSSNSVSTLKQLLALNKPSTDISKKSKNGKGFFNNISYGLHMNVNVPFKGECACNYFTDASGNNRAYKAFIPGVWISKKITKKQEMVLQFNPYQQYFTGNKSVSSKIMHSVQGFPADDTLISTTSVIKTSGLNAGIQYNYYISDKWSLGVGADYNTLSLALMAEEVKRTHDGKVFLYKTYGIKNTGDTSQYFKNSFITGNLNLMYNLKKFQVGARVRIPFTDLSFDKNNPVHPLSGQLFLRWKFK